MAVPTTDPICKEICDALGFSYARKVVITMEVGNCVKVEVEHFKADRDGLAKLPLIIGKYKLVPEVVDASTLGSAGATFMKDEVESVPPPPHFVNERDLPGDDREDESKW